MSKYEDEAMELIETMAENSHLNLAKPFGRGAMPKGQLIDAKSAETRMLLEINRQNGRSPKSLTGPTERPQRFQRDSPPLTP